MTLKLASADEILRLLGQRLRAQRLAQDLPQRELAQMAGVSLGALRTVESSGQCSLSTLVHVVQALGLIEAIDSLFLLERRSIAQMALAAATRQRQRAPRRPRQ